MERELLKHSPILWVCFSHSLCLILQEVPYAEIGLGTDRMHFKMSSLAASYSHSHTLHCREFEGFGAD